MFRASSRPSSGAQQPQYQPLVLPLERGDSSAVGRGQPDRPDHDQQHCYHHAHFNWALPTTTCFSTRVSSSGSPQTRRIAWSSIQHFRYSSQFLRFITWRLCTDQHVSGVLTPISRSSTTAVAASGFTLGASWQQCCWSWSARPRPTALLPPRSNDKTRGCYCSCWAPDDGREDARNMLSCT